MFLGHNIILINTILINSFSSNTMSRETKIKARLMAKNNYEYKDQNSNCFGCYLSLWCNKHQRRPKELTLAKKKKIADGTSSVENVKRENVTRCYKFIAKAVDILYQQG
ncbi:hypothetical protein RO3G_04231 [Rhizopus delemar RA 99-880]|uniref:Uncharacterized protein n=1 Tax=Rhizopus delemar (strain RA 99-880 / ATCC MYA-4621 / FGSC 9543 / NRRL 43880) TaxID=246409 RepID=I1BTJ6_RHIO9|nr:hypothetical protein RO3G_04231 [Rhizopus delemar RA 99-880]|eukprot:EIE79526.1 hypothetical protein RO3G_04231 [Rhizopus delemar RA 99-880]